MKLRLLALMALVALVACPAFTEEAAATDPAPTLQEQLDAVPAPEMNLQFKPLNNANLPPKFCGGNPDAERVDVVEDVTYPREEHSLAYNPEGSAQEAGLPAGVDFQGPPQINWTLEDAEGNAVGDQNNNEATSVGEFPEPGEYRVGNSGARQVGGSGGGASDTDNPEGDDSTGGTGAGGTGSETPGGDGSTGGTGAGGTGAETPEGEGADADGAAGRRLTSTQTRDVVCHDVTPPSVWAAIQEGAGDVTNFVEAEEQLRNALEEKMQQNMLSLILSHKEGRETTTDSAMGGMFSNLEETPLEHASLMAVFEYPINASPVTEQGKTAMCSVKGPVFNELGKTGTADRWGENGTVPSVVKVWEEQTRETRVTPATVGKKAVYVRRNVPFMIAAVARDNGDKYLGTADAACYIAKKGSDNPEPKVDNAYLFRKNNVDDKGNQVEGEPELEFVIKGADKFGNTTVVRLPLLVVNTQVSYEGGRNQ